MATPLLRLPTKLRENSYGMAHSLLCTPSRRPYNTVENYNILSRSIIKPRLTAKPFILPRISRTTLHRSQARLNSNKQIPATTPNPTPPLGTSNPIPPSLTLSQRFRQLSREYGWSAVGIYFLLSALDFPFCFLAVRVIGTERIGHWEHVIVGLVWRTFTLNGRVGMRGDSPDAGYINANAQSDKSAKDAEAEEAPKEVTVERGNRLGDTMEDRRWTWGVEEADEALKKSDATIWTQIALAYAIHKSFIFLRIPATIAVTPKVVKVLRGWGWNVGKMPKRTSKSSNSPGVED